MFFFNEKNILITIKGTNTQLYWCEKKYFKLEIINIGTLASLSFGKPCVECWMIQQKKTLKQALNTNILYTWTINFTLKFPH
jgi:hypothetical protein